MKKNCLKQLILLIVLLLFSCDNEPVFISEVGEISPETPTEQDSADPETPRENAVYIGSWRLTQVELIDVKAETTIGSQKIERDITGSASDYDYRITFNEDGTYNSSGNYMQTVTFTLISSQTTETFQVNAADFLSSGSYERYSSTLTLTNSRGEQQVEFLTIQDNGLVLLVPLDLTKTLQGYEIQFTGIAESTFERIE